MVDELEARGMIRHLDANWQLTASIAEVSGRRPDTVRQLIDIQIDHLDAPEQRVLEAASVAGATFAASAVAHALDAEVDGIDSICEMLANHGRFLRLVPAQAWPDGSIQSHYAFAHALFRDTALTRVPAVTARVWHRRVAEYLETVHGDHADQIAAELARHFDDARVVDKAVRYYCLAGERAMNRFGRRDAFAHLARARDLVSRLPVSESSERAELTVLKHLGPVTLALQGFHEPHLVQTFQRTAELARKLRDDRALSGALLGLERCHFLRGELLAIEDYEPEVSGLIARLDDPVLSAEAAVLSASARLFRGQLAIAKKPLVEACGVLEAAGADSGRIVNAPVVGLVRGHLVVMAWLSGAPDEAVTLSKKMIAHAEALADPFHLATAYTIAGLLHHWRGEPELTAQMAKLALNAAREMGTLVWLGRALCLYHWACGRLEPEKAHHHLEQLTAGLQEPLRAGPYGRTAFAPCLIELCAQAGQKELALRELGDALEYVENSDERAWSAELHRLRGELSGTADQAEMEFDKAGRIAHSQGARSFELRALMSSSRAKQGPERLASLRALQQVYDGFSEGFATRDLLEARRLLDATEVT